MRLSMNRPNLLYLVRPRTKPEADLTPLFALPKPCDRAAVERRRAQPVRQCGGHGGYQGEHLEQNWAENGLVYALVILRLSAPRRAA